MKKSLTAHYKYVYDGQGNIVRSIDILARKEYNYLYEDGKIMQSTESAIVLDECTNMVISKTAVCTVRYYYDNEDGIVKKHIKFADGKEFTENYEKTENDSQVVKFTAGGKTVISHSKNDSFGRKVFDELQLSTGFVSRQFTYLTGEVTQEHVDNNMLKSSPTTQLVSQIVLSGGRTISYEYDEEERITKVDDSVDGITEYTYDALGQLVTETKDSITTKFEYDNYGNILAKGVVDENGEISEATKITYEYGNEKWKDLLTSYNGQEIVYDEQGNPVNYLGHTLTWEKGRQLKRFVKDDGTVIDYTYNANGIRTSKTVDGIRHDFVLDGAKILRETWCNNTLVPLYDNEDSVCGIEYNGAAYYFLKNLQGDIIAITDNSGEEVARYSYDAWGVCTVTQDISNCDIANINPFRYRSYYFDRDTDLYYLQSRYYDPQVGRFVNGDEAMFLGANDSLIGYNIIAYCDNNPICFCDYSGNYIMYIYGKDQESAAKTNIKLLKKKYLVYGYFVQNHSDFEKVWNKKGTNRAGKLAKIDILIINLHGNHREVQYVNFRKLVSRNIDTLLLLSCNAGHLDYINTNPATSFYVNNSIRQLVCCDGIHYRNYQTKKVWKPTILNWFRTVKNEWIMHTVSGDDVFNEICISPRKSSGFILYTRKKNNRITGYRSIGYKFDTISSLLSKIGK